MILALNGVDPDFLGLGYLGELGATPNQGVAALQTALRNFGKSIGDAVLKAIVTDGLIGPKTTAAANRALTKHLGAGQAPQDLRTGALTSAQVVAKAAQITQLVNTEARRRGFSVYVGPVTVAKPVAKKVVKKSTKSTALVPASSSSASAESAYIPAEDAAVATYTPPARASGPVPARAASAGVTSVQIPSTKTYVVPSSSGADVSSIVKWGAIGLGVVALLGGVYYAVSRRRGGAPAIAGFGGELTDEEARELGRLKEKRRKGEMLTSREHIRFEDLLAKLDEFDERLYYNRDLTERMRNKPFKVGLYASDALGGGIPATMTAGQINKRLDQLDKESSKLTDEMIAAGRGYEKPSETFTKSDPLAERIKRNFNERTNLQREIEHRYGPGAPSRLPRGFGPLTR